MTRITYMSKTVGLLWATVSCREDGATAVEYALMVALIAIVIVGAVTTVGTELRAVFSNVNLHLALN